MTPDKKLYVVVEKAPDWSNEIIEVDAKDFLLNVVNKIPFGSKSGTPWVYVKDGNLYQSATNKRGSDTCFECETVEEAEDGMFHWLLTAVLCDDGLATDLKFADGLIAGVFESREDSERAIKEWDAL